MKLAIAKLTNLKIAPRKVRLLCDVLRGMPAVAALAQLQVTPHRAAGAVAKLIKSAIANAKNLKMDASKLVIKEIAVNQGMMLKRFLPRARGSASELQKKFCHVMVAVGEDVKMKMPEYTLYEKAKKVVKEKQAAKPKSKEEKEEPKVKGAKKAGFLRRTFNRKAV